MKWLMVMAAVTFIEHLQLADGSICNKAICASVVSKCMLTQSCKCDLTPNAVCSCCKECQTCLSYLFDECCACVDMCPGQTDLMGAGAVLSRKSYIEETPFGIPALFNDLTAFPDAKKRWISLSIPIIPTEISLQSVEEYSTKQNSLTGNCTVAYMSHCMSLEQCKTGCESMGSSSFRWFHDGCCECIGELCKHHGSDESRCLQCGEGKGHVTEETPAEEDDLELDYSENMEPDDADMV